MSAISVVLERNTVATGRLTTEPYESNWAREAIFFVNALDELTAPWSARVQISPDGLSWCDLPDARADLSPTGVTALRVSHFGAWLRLDVVSTDPASTIRCVVTLNAKGE